MAVKTGKRYICEKCGTEVIATKGGEGEIRCGDGTPYSEKK